MWDERILWAVIVAVLSKLFFSLNILTHYVAGGIIVVISLSLMLLKPRRPALETQGAFLSIVLSMQCKPVLEGLETESAYACTTTRSKSIAASGPSHSGGFFNKARNIVINNSTMTDVQVEDKTSRSKKCRILFRRLNSLFYIDAVMELLASHVIFGAAHDDSARNYPPRCHPGTRVKILQRLTTWFYNINRVKSLLWLSGPAGVGKSAIIQSFAESIEHPVASVFVSRPNKRNDPNRIFTTIAYQLAVHIDAYRNYIVERLTANPYLLNKNIQIQFQVFITEPFVERKIGAGGLPLAILLDGLDELEGADAQRDIIRLISTFTQEHPVAPLAWIITSRPEAHITNTFSETTIQDQFESEFIPVDSTEACQDVERFLRESFDTIRRDFPDTIPTSWPEEAALAKLAAAASGLFIFAETAIRFIRDPDHSNPVPRLQLVLSVIDRSKSVSAREQPFALLDNLYTEILLNIPSGLLPTTKLVLRLALSFRSHKLFGLRPWPRSPTLRGMIMILQLDHHTVYAALKKCLSTLRIPPWNEAHVDELTFLHASFADYLMDSERSGEFYIDIDGVEDDVLLFYLSMWHRYFGENSGTFGHVAVVLEKCL
jgi:hypothetical protein